MMPITSMVSMEANIRWMIIRLWRFFLPMTNILYYNREKCQHIELQTEIGDEEMRIGQGYDVHRLAEERKLIIGGVDIPYEKGLLGHSDADVLLHAVMDALLGAAAMGDIGKHFPDTDDKYKDADSMKLLEEVGRMLDERMYFIENIDATIIAQAPKMRPYIDEMRSNIAGALGIDIDQVNVKATTEEHLGFTGREEGISASAVCLLASPEEYSYDIQAAGCPGAACCPRRAAF